MNRSKNQSAEDDCIRKETVETDGATVHGDVIAEPDARNEGSPRGIENSGTLQPGKHPYDPVRVDIDPIAFALDRVQTFLIWIDEHRASFEKLRHTDPEAAESELSNLRHSTMEGMIYLQRLSELVLGGYSIDVNKRLPDSLKRGWFSFCVKQLRDSEPVPTENSTR